MANEIRTKTDAKATFTITLASLANGSARQSDMIANTNARPAAIVTLKIKAGTAPTANTLYEIYLLRGDDPSSSTHRTDGAGATDAAITIQNAPLLGTIRVTNTLNGVFYGEFDTAPLGLLGPEWGIAVKNSTGQALNATEGDHFKGYLTYCPEVQ